MSSGRAALVVALSCAGLAGCSISGSVMTSSGGLDGATVKLAGAAQRTTTTASDGSYAFGWLLSSGSHTVVPSKAGHEMTPVSREVTIDQYFQRVQGVNFVARKLEPVVAPVIGNITATDVQNDGTFDSINTASLLEARSSRVTYLNNYVTRRIVFEFDLSAVSRSVPVQSAILEFSVNGYGGGSNAVQVDFWGYSGDGALTLADATAGDAVVASIVISSLGRKQLDLKNYVQQLINSGASFLGLNIRMQSETATSNVDEHCNIAGYQSTSAISPPPKFTISY